MPAHRQPTHLLNPRYAKAAGRDTQNEPRPRGPLTERPRLPRAVAQCWDEIISLAPEGILQDCDAVIVELTARLWAKARSGKASAAEMTQLRTCLGELAMSPAARSRVTIKSAATERNEFADA
ncbi:MAG: hypothetical protein H7067_00665 [Burkholderiales bacterium]|nr:hypothetical protein [Opitutaceae bacterium]